jgi:cellulose biosynthesis protein BcsQ
MKVVALNSFYKKNEFKKHFVVTFASEKGGVGKTTIATNLAIYLKAMYEDLPVTVASFDNHFTLDHMLSFGPFPSHDITDLLGNSLASELTVLGQYGVQYIPSTKKLRAPPHSTCWLKERINASKFEGILILDTKPVLNWFTEAALLASDLVIAPIKDRAALTNVSTLNNVLSRVGNNGALWLLPSLVDLRAKDNKGNSFYQSLKMAAVDMKYQVLDMYISKSPNVESLASVSSLNIPSILSRARKTAVHGQIKQLADFVYGQFRCQLKEEILKQIFEKESNLDNKRSFDYVDSQLYSKSLENII